MKTIRCSTCLKELKVDDHNDESVAVGMCKDCLRDAYERAVRSSHTWSLEGDLSSDHFDTIVDDLVKGHE